jgi:uncharacterized protein YutD
MRNEDYIIRLWKQKEVRTFGRYREREREREREKGITVLGKYIVKV